MPSARPAGRALATLLLVNALIVLGAGCSPMSSRETRFGRIVGADRSWNIQRLDLDNPDAAGDLESIDESPPSAGKYLWIDVGRSEALATAHPEWIAGMGSHEDWRQKHPTTPRPDASTRIGVWPWTPIWYRAVLENRRAAIIKLLRGRTRGIAGVFLCHVQGAPSACGCGNEQCRWTVDYRMPGGPERLDSSPAAELVRTLRVELPDIEWIPVWVTECEERDQPGENSTGYCHTVGCFSGLCWKESTKELEALLAVTTGPVALLATARAFGRVHAGSAAELSGDWVSTAARLLEEMPARHQRPGLKSERLLVVVDSPGGAAAVTAELRTRVRGVVETSAPIEQSWSPRLIPVVGPGVPTQAPREAGHGHGKGDSKE